MKTNIITIPVYSKTAFQILNAMKSYLEKEQPDSWISHCNIISARPEINPTGECTLTNVFCGLSNAKAIKVLASSLQDFILKAKLLFAGEVFPGNSTQTLPPPSFNREDPLCQDKFFFYTFMGTVNPWALGPSAMQVPLDYGFVKLKVADVWLLIKFLSGESMQMLISRYGAETVDRIIGHPWDPMKSERAKLIFDANEEEYEVFKEENASLDRWYNKEYDKICSLYKQKQKALRDAYNAKLKIFSEDLEKVAEE